MAPLTNQATIQYSNDVKNVAPTIETVK